MPDAASPRTGRYAGLPVTLYAEADGRTVPYLTRRFVPHPERHALIREHVVGQGERLDLIAAAAFGDPGLAWRLCDASRAMDPQQLERPGRLVRVTQPPELSADA